MRRAKTLWFSEHLYVYISIRFTSSVGITASAKLLRINLRPQRVTHAMVHRLGRLRDIVQLLLNGIWMGEISGTLSR